LETLDTLLSEGAAAFSVDLAAEQTARLMKYKELLLEWNNKINLTAIEEDRDIIVKHFIDSFSILPYLRNSGEKLADVGTGAGFPGIPAKIAYESVNVLLLDSLDKRVNFLKTVIGELGLEGIEAVHARAEEAGADPVYRESFDASVARAVASLPVLLEYCLPLVKTGGVFIAMKGSSTEELGSSKKALEILGGEVEEVRELTLPFSDIKRNIIIVRKFRHTPTKYPRKPGKPAKDPLI
jgi:16S rRNA (guanine527-N7)-methyltransferase